MTAGSGFGSEGMPGIEGVSAPSSSVAVGGTLDLDTRAAAVGTGASVPFAPALTNDSSPAGDALPPGERYRIEPRQVADGPLIDGHLDEEVWLVAAVIDDFVQQEPSDGDPATERTVVRLLYDARALYIGVEAYDSRPDGVIATEKRRDSLRLLDEDNFQVILDTFHDRRSGYMFVTNPPGRTIARRSLCSQVHAVL